ncbi:hypothetical protein BJF78_21855 [Pseudonocardia sp. CNS-139]|nr:hypothetical protein BJF78_21855 [Pseudonocardia sp. CNS-139]
MVPDGRVDGVPVTWVVGLVLPSGDGRVAAPDGTGRDGWVASGEPGSVGCPCGVSAALATRKSCVSESSVWPSSGRTTARSASACASSRAAAMGSPATSASLALAMCCSTRTAASTDSARSA